MAQAFLKSTVIDNRAEIARVGLCLHLMLLSLCQTNLHDLHYGLHMLRTLWCLLQGCGHSGHSEHSDAPQQRAPVMLCSARSNSIEV